MTKKQLHARQTLFQDIYQSEGALFDTVKTSLKTNSQSVEKNVTVPKNAKRDPLGVFINLLGAKKYKAETLRRHKTKLQEKVS